jgi:hypothetical protein
MIQGFRRGLGGHAGFLESSKHASVSEIAEFGSSSISRAPSPLAGEGQGEVKGVSLARRAPGIV